MTKMEKIIAWLQYNDIKPATKKGQKLIERMLKYDDAVLDQMLGPRGLLKKGA